MSSGIQKGIEIHERNKTEEPKNQQDIVSQIMAYENGEMGTEDTYALFQNLVNSGLVWQLQGHYGRMAKALIEAGKIRPRESVPGDSDYNGNSTDLVDN